MNANIDLYYEKREDIFERIHNATNLEKLAMATLMACFTGLMAQVVVPLPWTPVPLTGQTFAFLLAGLFLGKRFGALSLIIYILGGIAGVAWFAGATSGIEILFCASGGYIIGGIFAAIFVGHFAEKYRKSRKFKNMFVILSIANFGLIYIPGIIVLSLSLYFSQGTFPSIMSLIIMGIAPFVLGDLLKIWGAATFSKLALPK